MTSPLRERRKQMLRDEILDASRTLLAEKSYAAMSMDELAAQVGISKPTLYSYFANKDELVVATTVREMEHLLALIEANSDGRTPLQRLTHLMRAIIHFHLDRTALAVRQLSPELIHLLQEHEESLACIRRIDSAIMALVQAAIAAGEIDPQLDPATVAPAFYALTTAPKLAQISKGLAPNPTAVVDTLVAIFERGVRPGR